jgi:hypothetical protein
MAKKAKKAKEGEEGQEEEEVILRVGLSSAGLFQVHLERQALGRFLRMPFRKRQLGPARQSAAKLSTQVIALGGSRAVAQRAASRP